MTSISDIISLVINLKESSNTPLKQLVLEAYDLYQLWNIISKNVELYHKLVNLLDTPPTVLNEEIQARHSFLKRFIYSMPVNTDDIEQSSIAGSIKQIHNSCIKYIVFDNVVTAVHKILSMIQQNTSIQIVVSDYKLKNLIECAIGIKRPLSNNKIAKILNTITFENEDTNIVDISHVRYNRDCTLFFNINPDIAWTNNIGHLWLSGRERELLGLTTHVNWNKLLHVSPSVYVFSKESDMPQWQRIQQGSIEKINAEYPQVRVYNEESISTEINDIIINATGVMNLMYNPYLLYLKNVLQLNPKKMYIDDIGKIYDVFYNILRADATTPLLNEVKQIDYFYYKKIQSFINMIPQWKYPSKKVNIDNITVIYSDNPQTQVANTSEINYYTLISSISAKEIIQGNKTGLMLQALSTGNEVHFNIISPDWHSNSGLNKKIIEVSRDVILGYREGIILAWDMFKQTNMLELKFDLDRAPASYKHLERVQ